MAAVMLKRIVVFSLCFISIFFLMNYLILNSLIDITKFTVQTRQYKNYLVNVTNSKYKQHIQTTRNDSQCGYFDTLDRSFSVSECNGRLGNVLILMALGLKMYITYGIPLILKEDQAQQLLGVFDVSSICDDDGKTFCIVLPKACSLPVNVPHVVSVPEERLREKGVKAYSDQLENSQQSKVELPKFPTYFELFGDPGFLNDFRARVPFTNEVLHFSQKLYQKILRENHCASSNCTLVSIHLRMGDYDGPLKAFGVRPITESDYFPNVMNRVLQDHSNPLFVLFSDDIEKATRYIQSVQPAKVVVASGFNATRGFNIQRGIDLALMSMVDVSIMTYGTFGYFGALLTKDKVVYYPKNHPIPKKNRIDVGIPGLIGIEWKTGNGRPPKSSLKDAVKISFEQKNITY